MSSNHPVNNIALVPASLLPLRERWQALANALPVGSILVCLPTDDAFHQGAWNDLVASIRAMGHQVLVISMEYFAGSLR